MKNLINKLKRVIFLQVKYFLLLTNSKHIKQERVFVAGMQRSGTNMLMDILEKSCETDVYHERDSRAFDNYQMREEAVIRKLSNRSIAPKFVIKSLCELQNLESLMSSFQPAKTIWIVRDYNDVVASMLKSFGNMEKQVLRIFRDNGSEWLGQGMTDKTRSELIELVEPGMGDKSASAMQWYFRNILFFDQKFENNKQVLLISYEELVNQPEIQVGKICDFIGIQFQPRMIKDIFSSSINRRKNPEIDPRVRVLCDELQLKFKKLLET
ncbi:MAG: hypothetical protein methR_P2607 [Methyloprofundus sp.]|nr:MAG: hypothetical protein methR_P2607 [Methyloprofundus sp.]